MDPRTAIIYQRFCIYILPKIAIFLVGRYVGEISANVIQDGMGHVITPRVTSVSTLNLPHTATSS
jgi:hypothetical protein